MISIFLQTISLKTEFLLGIILSDGLGDQMLLSFCLHGDVLFSYGRQPFLKHKVKHVYFYALILLIPYLLVPFIGQVPALILIKIIFIIVYKTRGNSWIRTLASYLLPITITNLVQSLISLTPLLNKDNPGVNLSLVLPIIISFLLPTCL